MNIFPSTKNIGVGLELSELLQVKNVALLQCIDKKKEEMVAMAMKRGLTDKEVLKCSQELDDLLNLRRRHLQKL